MIRLSCSRRSWLAARAREAAQTRVNGSMIRPHFGLQKRSSGYFYCPGHDEWAAGWRDGTLKREVEEVHTLK